MRTIPPQLESHIATRSTTLAYLYKIVRTDGVIFSITSHDADIVFEGRTYLANLGFDASAIVHSGRLDVDNMDVKGFLSAAGINASDIASGLWDFAEVFVYRVNWASVTDGAERLQRGWLGQMSLDEINVTTELRSMTQKLQSSLVETVTPGCKADLFDARCGLTPTEGVTMFSDVAVSTIISAQRQFTCASLTQDAAFFTSGKVTWTTGLNTGLSMEIKTHAASGNILLHQPMPYEIFETDEATFFAGCGKRYAEDCVAKFSNSENFRGFPFLPGAGAMLKGPG